MQLCLIDTSSWIEALRESGDVTVRERVATILKQGRACTCDLVLLELWNGAQGEEECRKLQELEDTLPRLNLDHETWDQAKELARDCRSIGITVPVTDILVYACVERYGAELEHRDGHFDLIRQALD